FQAEDGIRDFHVTGVQTCALPILALVGGAAVGFLLPQMWLSSKITRRQQEVVKSLPDALDLMSICVNAGLGFDQAMAQVYEKWEIGRASCRERGGDTVVNGG